MVILMKDWGETLLTRCQGAKVRSVLVDKIDDVDIIELDFEGVENATQSFLDESLGKMLFIIDFPKFTKKLRFRNTSPEIETGIKFVIANRLRDISS